MDGFFERERADAQVTLAAMDVVAAILPVVTDAAQRDMEILRAYIQYCDAQIAVRASK